ncbi:MAG: ATPase P, partial [Deltaproteobacteria bacterium]
MIRLDIPGKGIYEIENLVLDFNGTIAKDGRIHNKVKDRLNLLGKKLKVYILTADTRGDVEEKVRRLRVEVVRLEEGPEAEQKRDFVRKVGPQRTIAVGNGYNDHLMVKEAVLGIAVIGPEGAAKETVLNADVVVTDVLDALELILKP